MVGVAAGVMRMVAMTAAAAAVGGFALAAKGRAESAPPVAWPTMQLVSIDGAVIDTSAYEGRVVLLVNTASRCAFTPQYEGLEALWQDHQRAGLTVIGVPSNDFGGQEPGDNAAIANFCSSKYHVTFPMLEKATVTGKSPHPLFAWARRAGGKLAVPAWNFHKILIGRDGKFVAAFPSYVSPRSPQVMGAVERALATPAF